MGNGTAGTYSGAFRLNFALLAGDYGGNGLVDNGQDLLLWQQFLGAGWSQADGTGNGATTIADGATLQNGVLVGMLGSANIGRRLALQQTHGADLIDDEVVDAKDMALYLLNNVFTGEGDIDGDGLTTSADTLIVQRLLGTMSAWAPEISLQMVMAELEEEIPEPAVGDFAPWITNVIVSGSQSTHAAYSFDAVDGSGAQLVPVPVGGADTISIVFSEDVNVNSERLFVISLHLAVRPQLAEFHYDAATHMATWRYEGWALADQYLLSLSDLVTDVEGNYLDGEWVNPRVNWSTTAAISEFPSGDGNPGGDFNFVMTLLPGDADLNGIVDFADFGILQNHYGAALGQVFSYGDFNGDGAVNSIDFDLLNDSYGLYYQAIWIWADVDGDLDVDEDDLMCIGNNAGMANPTYADGDLTGDGAINMEDLDFALAQYGSGGWRINAVW